MANLLALENEKKRKHFFSEDQNIESIISLSHIFSYLMLNYTGKPSLAMAFIIFYLSMSFVTKKEDEGYKPATQRMVWSGIGHYNDSDIGLYRNYPEDAGHRELAKPDGLYGQNHSRAHLLALPRCGGVAMAYTSDFTKERR